MPKLSRNGFTLIEILVVLAVIGIVSAIIFPAVSRARERGYNATCKGNLRQIGMAIQQYNADSDGHYPQWFNEMQPTNRLALSSPGMGWSVRIQPYLKSTNLFQCPSDFRAATDDPELGTWSSQPAYTDYAYNWLVSGLEESKLTRSNRVIIVSDYWPSASWNGFGRLSDDSNTPGFSVWSGNPNRHSEGKNCLFVDGHVKWLLPNLISDGTNGLSDPTCASDEYVGTSCIY